MWKCHGWATWVMPPEKKPSRSASVKEMCCICCQPVSVSEDEDLFCSGSCLDPQVLHEHEWCKLWVIKKHKCPFLCYGCLNLGNQDQVATLKEEVEDLKWEIIQLKKSLWDLAAILTSQSLCSERMLLWCVEVSQKLLSQALSYPAQNGSLAVADLEI